MRPSIFSQFHPYLLATSFFAVGVFGNACGSYTAGGASDASADTTVPDGSSLGDANAFPDASSVDTGAPCPLGESRVGGVCCTGSSTCGSACCASGQVCSYDRCVNPGADCGTDADCADGEVCTSLGMRAGTGGAACSQVQVPIGKCVPKAPACANGSTTGCVEACQIIPPVRSFDPVLKYSFAGLPGEAGSNPGDSMATPIVVQLTDDDCDGKVTSHDIPEILVNTFANGAYYGAGVSQLRALTYDPATKDLRQRWAYNDVGGSMPPAAGDLDGDGVAEIVVCRRGSTATHSSANGLVALRADGTVFWQQTAATGVLCSHAPAIGDMDGDGTPEILVDRYLVDGRTGTLIRALPDTGASPTWRSVPLFADIDGDGNLDAVTGNGAYRLDGSAVFELSPADRSATYTWAVGDLDGDRKPELVYAAFTGPDHQLFVLDYDAAAPNHYRIVRRGLDINNGVSTATFCGRGSEYGAGSITVADFDGDGTPDVGLAGAVGYSTFSGKKLMNGAIPNAQTLLWFHTARDCSSAGTGSSVFDFDGDGHAEVLYGDEIKLWMLDGATGADKLQDSICNPNGTLSENPVVADIDGDDQADILHVATNYTGGDPNFQCAGGSRPSGLRVWSSASHSWTHTRRIWNEHSYHVTNVDEVGRIPAHERPNWVVPGLNNFRQNKAPGGEWAAPDATVTLSTSCIADTPLVARVSNRGEAVLPAGVVVTVTNSTGTVVATMTTTTPIYPGGFVDLSTSAPALSGILHAHLDLGATGAADCRPGNNDATFDGCDGGGR